jgi:hypothetical protein
VAQIPRDRIDIYTFKEGVLSRIAHDLKLNLGQFTVTHTDEEVTVVVDCTSLSVEGAVRNRRIQDNDLSTENKKDIERNIRDKVLKTTRYKSARFEGVLKDDVLVGSLLLCGHTNEIRGRVTLHEERYRADIELKPSRWGIKPYKALMGAIRLQDRVLIAFDIGSH